MRTTESDWVGTSDSAGCSICLRLPPTERAAEEATVCCDCCCCCCCCCAGGGGGCWACGGTRPLSIGTGFRGSRAPVAAM